MLIAGFAQKHTLSSVRSFAVTFTGPWKPLVLFNQPFADNGGSP
jgi:hypothetical protein